MTAAPEIRKLSSSPVILISGGANFLGARLTQSLLEKKFRVVVVDDLTTGKERNLERLKSNSRFSFLKYDLNEGLPARIKSVDHIVHLAGSEKHLWGQPEVSLRSLLTNALATKNLLDLAVACQANFLLVSSIEVYKGVLSSLNLDWYFGTRPEDTQTYSFVEAKRYAEALVFKYRQEHHLSAAIARLAEVYGEGMDLTASGTLGRYLTETLEKKRLTVHGDGLTREYYLYVDDAVDGLVKGLLTKAAEGKILPLAPEEPVTTLELAYLFKRLLQDEVEVAFSKSSGGLNPPEPRSITNENLKLIDWRAATPLTEGLTKTLGCFGRGPQPEAPPAPKASTPPTPSPTPPAKMSLLEFLGEVAPLPPKAASRQPSPPAPPIVPPVVPPIVPPAVPPPAPKGKAKITLKTASQPLKSRLRRLGRCFSRTKSPRWLIGLAVLILIGLGPSLVYAANLYRGVKSLQKLKEQVLSDNGEQLNELAAQARKLLARNQNPTYWETILFNPLNHPTRQAALGNLNQSLLYTTKAVQRLLVVEPVLSKLIRSLPPNSREKAPLVGDLKTIAPAVTEAKTNLALGQLAWENVDLTALPRLLRDRLDSPTVAAIAEGQDLLDQLEHLTPHLSQLLGFDAPQTYLLLFQNVNELRPTGGFIGSYGLLTLEKGKITNLAIDDIYNLDGLLDEKGKNIPPPEPLRQILGVENLRIRDANFDPDFPVSAALILDLYQQATDQKPAGVIATDLYLLEKLLQTTGPVYLAFYDEYISAENLYERAQYHSEAGYFQGSQQKKIFLSNLTHKILTTVFAEENQPLKNYLPTILNALTEKHLLVYLGDSQLQGELMQTDWTGKIPATGGDFLYAVDANLGATKANYFVNRSQKYQISNPTREGTLVGQATLSYDHSGESNAWPGGPYKNYLRVYVPRGAKLQTATLTKNDDSPLNVARYIATTTASDKTVFAYAFEIQAGETAVVTFTYQLPLTTDLDNYDLTVLKQPGTDAEPLTVIFELPFGRQLETAATDHNLQRSGNRLILTADLRQDLEISLPLD